MKAIMKFTGLKHAAIAAVCLLLGIFLAGLDVRPAHANENCCGGGGGMSGGGMSQEEKDAKKAKELQEDKNNRDASKNALDKVRGPRRGRGGQDRPLPDQSVRRPQDSGDTSSMIDILEDLVKDEVKNNENVKMFWECGKWVKKQAEDAVKKLVCNEVEEVEEGFDDKVEEVGFLPPLEETENPENRPGWVNKPPCDRLEIRGNLLDQRKNALNAQITEGYSAIKKFKADYALYQKKARAAVSKGDVGEQLIWESKAAKVSAKIAATYKRIAEIRQQIKALDPQYRVLEAAASERFHNCDKTTSAGHQTPPAN